MFQYMGHTAALVTAFFWSISATSMTSASRRIGSLGTNGWRILLGCTFLFLLHLIVSGTLWPSASSSQLATLGLSGVIGLIIGDGFLYQSYVEIGPRITLLIFNLSPFITAVMASFALSEKLSGKAWLGMLITLAGVLWVLYEENRKENGQKLHNLTRGIIFAILAAIGQSVGYVLAKPAMLGSNGVPTLSATLIRLFFAAAGFCIIGMIKKDFFKSKIILNSKRIFAFLFIGSFFGTAGIWMSLVALKYISAGIAATITATLPVMILPFVIFVHKEKVSWHAAIGALFTVVGVAILFTER